MVDHVENYFADRYSEFATPYAIQRRLIPWPMLTEEQRESFRKLHRKHAIEVKHLLASIYDGAAL